MIKKSLAILSVSAAFLVYAQDATVIRNSMDVYSNSGLSGSSKYNAMAGSMGALGAESSVLNSNPAGIGVAIASDLSGTLNINNSKNTTSLNGKAMDYTIKNTDLGQVGGIAVFEVGKSSPWKFVNLGVNYSTKSIEDYTETPGSSSIKFNLPNGDQLTYAGHAYNRLGDVTKMSIGIGGNYDNRIYVGGGINLHGSNLKQYDSAAMTFASDNTSEVFNKQYTPYLEDATGFSASVGVIGKINPQFRLGAALETPTWWSIKRSYQFYGYDAANDGEYSENRNFSSPLKVTLSASFVPSKNLALNVDYSLGLTKPKFGKMDSAAQTEMDNFLSANYKNLSEVRLGAEYRIDQFRVRGGYGLASNPFSDINLYTGKRQTIGAGIGYDFKSFYLDAAYNNISSTFNTPFLKGNSNAGTEYYSKSAYFANSTAVVSEVKNNRNNVSITLGWKF